MLEADAEGLNVGPLIADLVAEGISLQLVDIPVLHVEDIHVALGVVRKGTVGLSSGGIFKNKCELASFNGGLS